MRDLLFVWRGWTREVTGLERRCLDGPEGLVDTGCRWIEMIDSNSVEVLE